MNKQRGFLLIEVLIAVVIITIAVTAAASLLIQSVKSNISAGKYTVAASLAQKQLEYLKSRNTAVAWTQLTIPETGEVKLGADWQSEENNTVILNNTTYTLASLASKCPEDSADLVQIRVVVAWSGNSGDNIEMTAVFSKR